MTLQQVNMYQYSGIVHPNHPSYQEAEKLKEGIKPSDSNQNKIGALLTEAINTYLEQAKEASSPGEQAFFYANAREIINSRLSSSGELNKKTLLDECKACLNAAEKASRATDKAAWTFLAAKQLMPYFYISPLEENKREYELATHAFTTLGDLYRTHKKEIQLAPHFPEVLQTVKTYSISVVLPMPPKFIAAVYYTNAAFARHTLDNLSGSKDKTDTISLIDKAVEAMESVGLKMSQTWFNANFYETAALIHSFKLRLLPSDQMKAKTFKLHLEAARQFEELAQHEGSNMHFHTAKNLHAAAGHAPTEEKKLELQDRAAQFATQFLLSRNINLYLSQFYPNSLQTPELEAYKFLKNS